MQKGLDGFNWQLTFALGFTDNWQSTWLLPRIRAQIELSIAFVYNYKMSTSSSFARNSHLTQGGRTTMMTMPVNRITSQCKIKLSQKYCSWINLQLWNFCHSFLQWMVPPGWGANSSQSCRWCSFSGHKQRCWTVLSELRYKVAYNPNTFSLN